MFGLSGEHLLILAAVLLIFGPRKLPELGSSIGKAMRNFREGLNPPPSSGSLHDSDYRTHGTNSSQNQASAPQQIQHQQGPVTTQQQTTSGERAYDNTTRPPQSQV